MTVAPGPVPGLPTWRTLSLHHWLILARKYGKHRPCKLEMKYKERSPEDREAFMRRVLKIAETGTTDTIVDPWGNSVSVDDRVIGHTLLNPPRTPAVAWLRFTITNAIELWEKPVVTKDGTENRRYYLAAVNDPEKRGVVVITHGGVAFNVIDFDPPYAENLRTGTLLEAIYRDDRKYCTSHNCCEDVVDMEESLRKAERGRVTAIDDAKAAKKRLKMKNPPAS